MTIYIDGVYITDISVEVRLGGEGGWGVGYKHEPILSM